MNRLSLLTWLVLSGIVAASGALYAVLFTSGTPLVGVLYAEASFLPLLAFRQRRVAPGLHDWLNGLPTVIYLIAELVIYSVIIMVGFAVAGTLMWLVGLQTERWIDAAVLDPAVIAYALVVSSIVIFVLRMRDLIGREVFKSLLLGRYRKPVSEERIFLFIDLAGSTTYAEKHGDLKAQQYLAALYRVMADPVRAHHGSINDYIGDCAIITWPIARGLRDADCVRCVFAVRDRIAARSDLWLRRYGEVPRLRAALHGGPVVTAEVGVDYHKIAYFGDTVNTTARLEKLCRTVDADVLISNDLLARLRLPPHLKALDKGAFALRGRGQEVAVSALEQSPSALSAGSGQRQRIAAA